MKLLFLSVLLLVFTFLGGQAFAAGAGVSIYALKGVWQNQDGVKTELSSFKGRPTVIAMSYTSCTYSCPLIVADLKRIEVALPEKTRERVRFVLASFDPGNDTPKVLKEFALKKELNLENRWVLITGKSADVRMLAALLGVKYKKNADGDFSHSNIITVLDDQGVIRYQHMGLNKPVEEAIEAVKKVVVPSPQL